MLEVKINVVALARKAEYLGNEKLLLKDCKIILKYVLHITDDVATMSSFLTKKSVKDKLENVQWKQFFIEPKRILVDITIDKSCKGSNDDNMVLTNNIESENV